MLRSEHRYSVSVLFLLIMILVLVNFIIALMNDEYAEVKQRAAMHWARLQASMLIDEVSVRDRILQSKLYVVFEREAREYQSLSIVSLEHKYILCENI